MFKYLILLGLMLLNVACGKAPYINPELQPMLDRYLALAPNVGALDHLEVLDFGELDEGVDGICYVKTKTLVNQTYNVDNEIYIRHMPDDSRRDAVVAHELAHCLHGIKHSDIPGHLMAPKGLTYQGEAYWDEHLDDAIRNLFK